jgi:hypothetical protein
MARRRSVRANPAVAAFVESDQEENIMSARRFITFTLILAGWSIASVGHAATGPKCAHTAKFARCLQVQKEWCMSGPGAARDSKAMGMHCDAIARNICDEMIRHC